MYDCKINDASINAIKDIIARGTQFVILSHKNPDGDAVGSSLALLLYLRSVGKTAHIVLPNNFPDSLRWLPAVDDIILYDTDKERADVVLKNSDALFCLDFNALSRIADAVEVVSSLSIPLVLVDHHPSPDSVFDVAISHTAACSTSELIFRLITLLAPVEQFTREMAECVYTGMMTDTGNFAYASNRKDIYMILYHLLATGIDKDAIYRKVFYSYSAQRMKLWGFMLYEKLRVFHRYNAALLRLTHGETRRFNVVKGDTEGLVNMPLQIKGVRFSCFLREEQPGKINVSLRSVDDFPCNEVAAEFFGGGGHKNASGGEFRGSIELATERFKAALVKYEHLLVD